MLEVSIREDVDRWEAKRRMEGIINMEQRRVDLMEMKREEQKSESLKNLLEEYIRKSEELERRESRVLRQVDLMQAAVASLQEWSDRRNRSEPVRIAVKEIEEETRQIKEETRRIQEEVRQKKEDNKRLEEEVKRKKSEKPKEESFAKKADEAALLENAGGREFETWSLRPSAPPGADAEREGVQFFQDKIDKLALLEKRLRLESDEEPEQPRTRSASLKSATDDPEDTLEDASEGTESIDHS